MVSGKFYVHEIIRYQIYTYFMYFIYYYIDVCRVICCLITGVEVNTAWNIQLNLFNNLTIIRRRCQKGSYYNPVLFKKYTVGISLSYFGYSFSTFSFLCSYIFNDLMHINLDRSHKMDYGKEYTMYVYVGIINSINISHLTSIRWHISI